MVRVAADLTGQQYGRWAVLSPVISKPKYWNCRCVCGVERQVFVGALRSGKSLSCGCYRSEVSSGRLSKHGHAQLGNQSPTYTAWRQIMNACTQTSSTVYKKVGARGIGFDPRWNEFEAFLQDMGERPAGGFIARHDETKDFDKANCFWSSKRNGERAPETLTYRGATKTITAWAKELGIDSATIFSRLRRGKSAEEALKPARSKAMSSK
jgi:hypothetical protein